MHITCEQQHLAKGVQIVQRAISTRTTMPILGNILLETAKDKIKLAATDLELGIQTEVPAAIGQGGAITLSAKILGDIVSNLPEAPVEMKVGENGTEAEIRCENTEFVIPGVPATDFPLIPDPDATVVATIDAALLRAMVRQTVFAVSADDTRPFLTGVFLNLDGETLRLVATDGGRLALRTVELPRGSEQKFGVIVPAKTMQELARVLGSSGGECAVALAENHLIFSLPEVRLVSRLIAGQFPNYQQVIPQSHKQRLQLNTERFLRAIRRAHITARDSANVVRLSAKDSELTVTSNTPEVGKTTERVPVRSEGETVQVAFNARYLIDCLSILETDELVFELSGPLTPGAIRPTGQQEYVYVLAPVRVYA
jgi:DNA polymerase-3 subunit beta